MMSDMKGLVMGDVALQALFRGCMITVYVNPVKPIYVYIPPIDYPKLAGFTQEERLCMKMHRYILHGQVEVAKTDQAPFWVYQNAIACQKKTDVLKAYCMLNPQFAKFIKKECAVAILNGQPGTDILGLAGLFKVTRNTDAWEAYSRMRCDRTRKNIQQSFMRLDRKHQIAVAKEKKVAAERVKAYVSLDQ